MALSAMLSACLIGTPTLHGAEDDIMVDDGAMFSTPSAIMIDSGDNNALRPSGSTGDADLYLRGRNNGIVRVENPLRVGTTEHINGTRTTGTLQAWANIEEYDVPGGGGTIEPNDHAEIHHDHERALFQIKTWPDPDRDYKIENSIETWGSFESYWAATFWAERPPSATVDMPMASNHDAKNAGFSGPVYITRNEADPEKPMIYLYDEISINGSTGEVGQVIMKTENGLAWVDANSICSCCEK